MAITLYGTATVACSYFVHGEKIIKNWYITKRQDVTKFVETELLLLRVQLIQLDVVLEEVSKM